MLAMAFQQTHVCTTSYSCLEFPRTARTGNWFPRMENAGNPASENLQWRKLVSENPVYRKPVFLEEPFSATRRIEARIEATCSRAKIIAILLTFSLLGGIVEVSRERR